MGKASRNIGSNSPNIQVSKSGKVFCLGMDCLDAVNYLKKSEIQIDCMVSLSEGIYEGGAQYPINSDMFLGHAMKIFSDEYIHIMNQNYYQREHHHVTMDLPYLKTEIFEGDQDYLNPYLFSEDEYHKGNAKVFRMKKYTSVKYLNINPKIRLSIIHDSIWKYKDKLDLIAISILPQGQGNFFNRSGKVVSLRDLSITEILDHCVQNKIERIGFTPWGNGNYFSFVNLIKNYSKEYPKEISLFHLNNNDFSSLKNLM